MILARCNANDSDVVNGYQFCYLSNFKGNLAESKFVKSGRSSNFDKNRFVKTEKPIEVKDLDSGLSHNYESTSDFAREMGVEKKTIQKAVSLNSGYYKNYLIRYRNTSLPSEGSS